MDERTDKGNYRVASRIFLTCELLEAHALTQEMSAFDSARSLPLKLLTKTIMFNNCQRSQGIRQWGKIIDKG